MDTTGLEHSDAEAEAVAKAPRVTLEYLKSLVVSQEYWHPRICPELTICVLMLKNGFTLVGKSAPASPANFDQKLGVKMAGEDALRQAWALEGYLLKEKIHLENERISSFDNDEEERP